MPDTIGEIGPEENPSSLQRISDLMAENPDFLETAFLERARNGDVDAANIIVAANAYVNSHFGESDSPLSLVERLRYKQSFLAGYAFSEVDGEVREFDAWFSQDVEQEADLAQPETEAKEKRFRPRRSFFPRTRAAFVAFLALKNS
ncbi:hypothetical protein KC963_02605 [Candidatus Saccharibacteria bacterium]|nr:hypothetical protein [Candidatus Saccharibacteria bacterium]MCA9337144.1 hypothetical protein [Candidatus Saccharibacteria bacterium]